MKFRKRPVVIEAYQLQEPTTVEILEGTMHGNAGDWLLTGVVGELYICADSVFRQTYDPVDGSWCQACSAVSAYPDGWCEQHRPQYQEVQEPERVPLAQRRRLRERGG